MYDNSLTGRWYDKDTTISEILEIIEDLPADRQEELSVTVISLINLLRKSRPEEEDGPISIGKNRVLGLYKSFNRRRWYDRNLSLMSAMNAISTLPAQERREITEGLLSSLSDEKMPETIN